MNTERICGLRIYWTESTFAFSYEIAGLHVHTSINVDCDKNVDRLRYLIKNHFFFKDFFFTNLINKVLVLTIKPVPLWFSSLCLLLIMLIMPMKPFPIYVLLLSTQTCVSLQWIQKIVMWQPLLVYDSIVVAFHVTFFRCNFISELLQNSIFSKFSKIFYGGGVWGNVNLLLYSRYYLKSIFILKISIKFKIKRY